MFFGASWCPQELSQIAGVYKKWQKNGVEVVFVSLDEDQKIFKSFSAVFPFIQCMRLQKVGKPNPTPRHYGWDLLNEYCFDWFPAGLEIRFFAGSMILSGKHVD